MAQSHTRRRALTLIGTAGGIALAGCMGGSEDDEMGGNESGEETSDDKMGGSESDEAMANVRVAHLSPDAPNVDVSVDGDTVLEDVPYRAVSDYLELAPDTYTVMIAAAGDPDTVVFEDDLEIPAGAFTIAALGELSEENSERAPSPLAGYLVRSDFRLAFLGCLGR